jgi:hypothetical protein
MHRLIGFLQDATAAGSEFMVNGLRKGLAEAGFVEGRNLTIEYAWTDGRSERLPALAAELVSRHVPVIVSSALNATYAGKCAKRVSRKSRWSRSSARRIASQCRWWPSGTGSASRRSIHQAPEATRGRECAAEEAGCRA